eukprot:m.120756 g.120756  ORF g.120756 m.120756 type:complete len:67 (+) comp37741_c0_seq8:699-899(+)
MVPTLCMHSNPLGMLACYTVLSMHYSTLGCYFLLLILQPSAAMRENSAFAEQLSLLKLFLSTGIVN